MEHLLFPIISQYWQPVLGLVFGFFLNYILSNKIITREQVAPYEDYLALVIDLGVHVAESSGLPGADKLDLAKETIVQQLQKAGFEGRASDINTERVLDDIEAAVAKYFSKK